MNAHAATLRRTSFWFAMLTGAALVGMQFGCIGPPSILAAPGFPRASRRIEPKPEEAMKGKLPREEASPEAKASMYWTRTKVSPVSGATSPEPRT